VSRFNVFTITARQRLGKSLQFTGPLPGLLQNDRGRSIAGINSPLAPAITAAARRGIQGELPMFSAFRRPGHASDSDAVYAAISRSQAVIEFSLDGTVLTANDNFLSALGYSLEEIRGKHHSLFVDPSERDTPAYRQFWTNLRAGQVESGEFKRIAKGGREVWIQATYNPVLDASGKPVKVIKFALDVTAKAIDNRRIRVALDKVASNVMVADADGRIIYMNESVTTMFRNTGAEIRKELPQFDAERVLGSSFDAFHRSPSHQRNLLATLKNTHITEIKLGGVVLKIIATPVVDQSGNRLGTVVQWINRTTEVTTEDEVKRVVEAANTGNLTLRVDKTGKTGFFEVLAGGMNELLETNATLVREIQRATAEVSSSADEISKGNLNLSQRTEEQAASLEETASSMEQMTSTVRQNAENAATASQLRTALKTLREKAPVPA
jgi:methyl-accepting chemotaxis protein